MYFLYNPALNIVWILLGVLGICLIVFLLRKFIPGIKGDDQTPLDENKQAEENLKNRLVDVKEEKDENEDEEEQKETKDEE